jgi:hypothetical protein
MSLWWDTDTPLALQPAICSFGKSFAELLRLRLAAAGVGTLVDAAMLLRRQGADDPTLLRLAPALGELAIVWRLCFPVVLGTVFGGLGLPAGLAVS